MATSIVKILRVVADPNRLRILLLLKTEELSVAELQEILVMGQSNQSVSRTPAASSGPQSDRADLIVCQLSQPLFGDVRRSSLEDAAVSREALSLASLPPALRYLNTRILQMHDIWHLAGGFKTTALHEIAISAFQQAQFGHGYSAMFLAVVTAASVPSVAAVAPHGA